MIKVEIWSDINCPFCYIGKRHFEAALEKFPKKDQVQVEWKSFELDPTANPPKGADNYELLAKKYGKDRKWAVEMNQNLTQMAAKAGLKFDTEHAVPANSFNAHRLIHLAKQNGLQDQMKEKLLSAKFVECKDINDEATLVEQGLKVGLNEAEIKDVLESEKFSVEVREDETKAAQLGISGVPFFVFNQKYALSGAQPVEAFTELLSQL